MNALLVGADRLGNIPDLLAEYGIRIASHVTGRDPSSQRAERAVSAGIDIMILFTDFVGHNVMRGYRDAARRRGTRFLACRRSVCSLRSALDTIQCAACKAGDDAQRTPLDSLLVRCARPPRPAILAQRKLPASRTS